MSVGERRVKGSSSASESSIVFTAYSISSEFFSDSICVTTAGDEVTLPSLYTFPVNLSEPNFMTSAEISLFDFLGFSSCYSTAIIQPSVNATASDLGAMTSTILATSLSPSQTRSSSTAPPQSHSEDFSMGTKAGVGVAVSVAIFVVFAVAALFFLKRKHGRKLAKSNLSTGSSSQDVQPYLQQKGVGRRRKTNPRT